MKYHLLTANLMYKALVDRDSRFEGQFFVGVKTTGVFCRPTCSAKKPKKDNVEYFLTSKEALSNGYRPCKICVPMESVREIPSEIKSLLQSLNSNPEIKISDYELVKLGLEPNSIRRWFMKNHEMTFQAYQRFLRINAAFGNIKKGKKIIQVAYKSGYESLSGFQYAYKKVTRLSPKESKENERISFVRFPTILGTMFAAANDKGICLLEFADRKMLETELKLFGKNLNAQILPGSNEYLELLQKEISEYFKGDRKQFDIPLVTFGTAFQKSVWKVLQEIPYGKTISYKDQAIALGNEKAFRAVANANGTNKISIIIPCHRVIGENRKLTGYGGGIWRKKWLLDHEKSIIGRL